MLQAPLGFMDIHRIQSIQLGTDVKVLEVLLWGRIASQPPFSWLVHAASAPAAKPLFASALVQKGRGWSLRHLEVSCPCFAH